MQLEILQKKDLNDIKSSIIQEVRTLFTHLIQEGVKKEWLTEQEAMKLLDVSKSTIQTYRRRGEIAFSQNGSKIYYRYEDLNKFLLKNYINNG